MTSMISDQLGIPELRERKKKKKKEDICIRLPKEDSGVGKGHGPMWDPRIVSLEGMTLIIDQYKKKTW